MANKSAKSALEQFKMEAANQVGVQLKNGYNGDLTAREAGSIGGQMVNNICPVRTVHRHSSEDRKRIVDGHFAGVEYISEICV